MNHVKVYEMICSVTCANLFLNLFLGIFKKFIKFSSVQKILCNKPMVPFASIFYVCVFVYIIEKKLNPGTIYIFIFNRKFSLERTTALN